jgi:acyl-CoA thioester hydrolase
VGRTEWLRAHGTSYREVEAGGVVLPVIEAHCDYRVPMRYDDEVEIRTRAVLRSPVRVEFDYAIVRHADGAVAATGRTIHAATDSGGRPRRLPVRIRSLFS